MSRTYLIISLTMLAVNLMMEYGTLTRRRSLATHILSRSAASVAAVAAMLLLGRFGLLSFYLLRAVATLPYYFSCQYLFTETVAQKTFLYFMDYSANAVLSTICVWIAASLPLGRYEDLAASALYVLLVILFLPLYFRRIRPRVRRMLTLFRNSNPLYAAFPVLSFAVFATVFGPVNVHASLEWFATMALFVCQTALTYVMLFSHFTSAYDRLKAEATALRAERQLALQKRYYEEVDRGIRAQGKLIHDTRHHMVAIASMAQAGEGRAVEEYVEKLLDVYAPPGIRQFCGDAAVNAVIGGYVTLAEEKGIAVSTEIDLPEGIGIDAYELCTFYGNTIENAIEACERIPPSSPLHGERYIAIESWIERGRLVVRMENSFEDEPGRDEAELASSKGSGIGLESVRTVVERHQGSMSCERHGRVFILSAVLCLPAGSAAPAPAAEARREPSPRR